MKKTFCYLFAFLSFMAFIAFASLVSIKTITIAQVTVLSIILFTCGIYLYAAKNFTK